VHTKPLSNISRPRRGQIAATALGIAFVLVLCGCGSKQDQASVAQLEQELQSLRATNQELQRMRTENQELARLRRDNEETRRLREQTKNLPQLRDENAQLRGQLAALKAPKPKQ
jgi:hypothetical protein